MFTVCPKCVLTLAVTANDLRMGQGYVRCGRCANVFNALLTLSEEPVEDSSASTPTPADRASSSQIAAALRDAAPEAPATGAELHTHVEAASGPSIHLSTEQSSDGSIENQSNFAEGTGTFETIVLEGETISQTEEFVPEASVDSEIAALTQRLEMTDHEPVVEPAQHAGADATEIESADDDAGDIDAGDSDADDGDAIDAASLEPSPSLSSRTLPGPRWAWIAGGVVMLLLLALQVMHHWRDALAASAPGSILSRAYGAIGMPLDPHWDLAAYDVRQQGAAADPSDNQIIRVRLSLANHAARPQPLPLLRLTLLDRYGKRLATGEVMPDQYWPSGVPPRAFLSREERIDSEVALRDPSAASASFELDVCLRGRSGALHCAGDASNSATAGTVAP